MLSLKFNSSMQTLPSNGQCVVFLKQGKSFGISDNSLESCTVYYLVTNGDTSWRYNEDDPVEDCDMVGVFIGHKDATQENIWWIDEEEYWKQIDDAEGWLNKCHT